MSKRRTFTLFFPVDIMEGSFTAIGTRGMSQLADMLVDIIPDNNEYILSIKLKFKKRK